MLRKQDNAGLIELRPCKDCYNEQKISSNTLAFLVFHQFHFFRDLIMKLTECISQPLVKLSSEAVCIQHLRIQVLI